MKLLIPGGAGCIGLYMVSYAQEHAQEHAHEGMMLDDFSTGHEWAFTDCEILRVDLLDQDELAQLLKGCSFYGVIHFAAKSLIGESVKKPDPYYRNNVVGKLNVVNELINNEIHNLVFSSTAAIREINWRPSFDKLDDIVTSAWRRHSFKVSKLWRVISCSH